MKKVVAFLTLLTLGLTSCGTQNQVPEQNASDGKLQAQKLYTNGRVMTCTTEGAPVGSSNGSLYTCIVKGFSYPKIMSAGSTLDAKIRIAKDGAIVDFKCNIPAHTGYNAYCENNFGIVELWIQLIGSKKHSLGENIIFSGIY